MVFSFEQFRPTRAIIHLDNLRHNVRLLKELAGPGVFFCPMVKANAYGHGDFEIARELVANGVQNLGVVLVEEGLALRGMGIQCDILVFALTDVRGARACIEAGLTPVLSSWEQVRGFQAALPKDKNLRVHLKFDTGMKRLGFDVSEAPKLVEFFEQNANFRLEGVLTHLHSGEDASDPNGESFGQLRRLHEVAQSFAAWTTNVHALNSSGLIGLANLRTRGQESIGGVSLRQGARPGLALYGATVVELPGNQQLKPVMSFRSQVALVRRVETGEGVSYGHRWKAPRPSWIGVIPVGYADGFHRLLSNRAEVLIEGRRVSQVGTVCMDSFMVDLTDLVGSATPTSFLWKEVTLFGYDSKGNLLSTNEVATRAETIPWEVLTSVGERVPRVYEGRSE